MDIQISLPKDPVFPSEQINYTRKSADGNFFNVRNITFPTKNINSYNSLQKRLINGKIQVPSNNLLHQQNSGSFSTNKLNYEPAQIMAARDTSLKKIQSTFLLSGKRKD